jgi:hypothetical protein
MKTMTPQAAADAGYRALTTEYKLPEQQWMLDRVLADMKHGGIDTVLVATTRGPEVWRRGPHSQSN